jgi:hypothetical protein
VRLKEPDTSFMQVSSFARISGKKVRDQSDRYWR